MTRERASSLETDGRSELLKVLEETSRPASSIAAAKA